MTASQFDVIDVLRAMLTRRLDGVPLVQFEECYAVLMHHAGKECSRNEIDVIFPGDLTQLLTDLLKQQSAELLFHFLIRWPFLLFLDIFRAGVAAGAGMYRAIGFHTDISAFAGVWRVFTVHSGLHEFTGIAFHGAVLATVEDIFFLFG